MPSLILTLLSTCVVMGLNVSSYIISYIPGRPPSVWLRASDVWWLVDSRQLRDGGPGLVGGACQGVDEGGHVHHRTKPSPHILANISRLTETLQEKPIG